MLRQIVCFALVAVFVAAQRPSPSPCMNCDFVIQRAVRHLKGNSYDQAGLQKELHRDCMDLGRFEGADAEKQCLSFVDANIAKIFADLTGGDGVWQTCSDLGLCTGTEPPHHTFPSRAPAARRV